MGAGRQNCLSCEGQVQVECSIVILLTELCKWGRVGKIVSRAMGISLLSADIFMSRRRMLNTVRRLSLCARNICANGPAVEGVNVGGAVRRYESRFFSRKVVPAASHHGAIFANQGIGY